MDGGKALPELGTWTSTHTCISVSMALHSHHCGLTARAHERPPTERFANVGLRETAESEEFYVIS